MTFAARLKQLRDESNLNQTELGRIVGVSRSAIAMYEAGEREPDFEVEEALADFFNVPIDYLRGRQDSANFQQPHITDDVVYFPVLGDVAAGFEHIALTDWEGATAEFPRSALRGRPAEDYLALRVCGDSMYPFYLDGDVVLVLRSATLEHDGQVALIIYDGENATLKKVEQLQDGLRLVPLNPIYPPRTINGVDLEQCSIIGIPRLLLRNVE